MTLIHLESLEEDGDGEVGDEVEIWKEAAVRLLTYGSFVTTIYVGVGGRQIYK
jgi:hypothetical protein